MKDTAQLLTELSEENRLRAQGFMMALLMEQEEAEEKQ